MDFKLEREGKYGWKVFLDDKLVYPTGLTISVSAKDLIPKLVLELDLLPEDGLLLDDVFYGGQVIIPDYTADILKQLGWTPPKPVES